MEDEFTTLSKRDIKIILDKKYESHDISELGKIKSAALRKKVKDVEAYILKEVPISAGSKQALLKLEECFMWANVAITRENNRGL